MKTLKNALTQLKLTSLLAVAAYGPVVFAGPAVAAAKPKAPPVPPPGTLAEDEVLATLKDRMLKKHDEQDAIRAAADAEERLLNEEENAKLDELANEFDALDAEVKRRERVIAQRAKLSTPEPRRARPAADPSEDGPVTSQQELVAMKSKNWGWNSPGQFARAVRDAAKAGARPDTRLVAAATTYGNEASADDGGFAVPPDFREQIVKKLQAEEGLLSRTDEQFTSSNKLTVPTDNTTPWQTSGGIQVYWEGEGVAPSGSKPALNQMEVKANKMFALIPMTDELLQDAPSLTGYLPGKVADKFTSKINDAIINGDGAGKPQGLLSAKSKLQVAKESGQSAATIVYANVVKMWSRLYAPLRAGAIWLANQDIEPQLLSLVVPGTTAAFPAYLPPGGLSASPYGTLMGRPVIAQEGCQTLGTEGDLILVNLQSYLTVQKVGGMRQDVSIHVYFEQDIAAFRFIMRMGGQSWWNDVAARKNGSNTLSNIITLQGR